jgi:hypothetical protein
VIELLSIGLFIGLLPGLFNFLLKTLTKLHKLWSKTTLLTFYFLIFIFKK